MAEEDQQQQQHKPETTSTAEAVAVTEEKVAQVETEAEKSTPPPAEEVKPESNVAGDLPEAQKKALEELKALVQEALNKHEFTKPPQPKPEAVTETASGKKQPEVVTEESATEVVTESAAATEVVTDSVTQSAAAAEVVTESAVTEKPEVVTTAVTESAEKPEEPALVVPDDDDGAKTVEAIEETVVSSVVASAPPEKEPEAEVELEPPVPTEPEEVYIFGIRLLEDSKSDSILLKFLRARDFKPKEALSMIKSTVWWRKEFGIESLLEEDLGSSELGKAVFMKGTDKDGHPVCYNAYGEFQDKELYQSAFSDEEKRARFLKWRIQFLERSIRKLDFSPTGINTIVQVNDLKNSPGPAKRELRQATNQALDLLQDNYPEFVAKQVFINVPWWYLAFNRMISPFLTQRTKSKFVFAGPSKTADTLFKYIAPEQVPVQYGGLSREGEQEFTSADSVTEFIIKPATKHTVELPVVSEAGVLVWEVRIIGWEVSYGAEFVPSAEDAYTVIVQKARKVVPTDEPVISGSFKVGESGKVVLTFDNQSSKKKKMLYRSKTKACSE